MANNQNSKRKGSAKKKGEKSAPQAKGALPVHNVQTKGMVPRILAAQGTSIRIKNTEFMTGYSVPYSGAITPYDRGAGKGFVQSSSVPEVANANYGTIYVMPGAFTWLKTIAAGYSKYKFHNLKFHYQSQVGTQTNGFATMSVVHDPEDLPLGGGFASIGAAVARVNQNETYVSGPAWSPDLILEYDGTKSIFKSYPNSAYNQFVSENVGLSAGTNPYAASVAQAAFIWTIENGPSLANFGRIFATYDVELSHPVSPGFSAS